MDKSKSEETKEQRKIRPVKMEKQMQKKDHKNWTMDEEVDQRV